MDSSNLRLAIALRQLAQSKRAAEFSADACSFGPQRRAIKSRHRRKVLRCGRRSGKTSGVALALLEAALDDSVMLPVLYVTLTRANAKEIIWDELIRLNEEFKLGFVIKEGVLDLVSPKGIKIQLRGAHTKREVSKYRGKKFKLVVIDEMQSFPDNVIDTLVTDAIMPTLLDVGGTLWLVGTRPALRKGYFWRCFAGDLAEGKELHSWTVRENEKLPAVLAGRNIEDVLAEFRKDNGWAEDNKTYRREILDEDIEDRDALLFQFRKDKNAYEKLPDGEWANVLCWDLGVGGDEEKANEGATMYIAILGWRKGTREVYLREEWAGNRAGDDKEDITDAAKQAHRLADKYHPDSMVIDQGALGKLIALEIRRRHQLPVKPAEKTNKGGFIALLNTAMRKGEFFAKADSVFAQECELVHKDFAALANGGKLQELPASKGGFHGNATDGVLYGWRECKAFFETEEPAHPPGYEPPSEHILQVLEQQRIDQDADPYAAALGYVD